MIYFPSSGRQNYSTSYWKVRCRKPLEVRRAYLIGCVPNITGSGSFLQPQATITNLLLRMAIDIRTSELKSPIDVAEYLFRRLYEVGIRGIHGVPGDYNLVILICC